MRPKVFCIGFHKTGTTSLAAALETLGYRVTGPNGVDDPNIADNVYALADALLKVYDAFQDNPWPIIYQYLDEQHPKSRFILTLRDSDAWIKSQLSHFGSTETPMRKWIYGRGCPKGNEAIYLERFQRHNSEVLDYFKNRPDDLLVLDLVKGDGWEKLCPFLGAEIPAAPFPHLNKAQDRNRMPSPGVKLFKILKRWGQKLALR